MTLIEGGDDMKVTIIGAGNMGGATALGLAKAGRIAASDITVTARHASTLAKFKEAGINTCLDNVKAVKGADIIIIAVKPWVVPDVCAEIRGTLDFDRQKIVSMAPGVKSEELLGYLEVKNDTKTNLTPSLTYVIPNTAIEICESMTFVSAATASAEDEKAIAALFEGTGKVMAVPMSRLAAGTALASCGIAYALRYIRAAAEGGVEMGFYAKDAEAVVAQTVKGAAALLEASGKHPEEEIDKVTTPGGLTIKGLNAMEEAGFTNAVIKGLKAGK